MNEKGKHRMTEEQKAYVYAAGEKIRELPGGNDFTVYCAISIGRLQYKKDDKHFRMFCILKDEGQKEIEDKLLRLFNELQETIKERT